MKTPLLFLPAVFAALLAGCQSTSVPPFDPADGRVTVTFHEQTKFTDAKDRGFGETSQSVLNELSAYVQRESRRLLQPGEKFQITFTNVDLAGDFEPWRGPQASDIRIVKPIYPPRFEFSYVHADADGKVISEGKERITDLAFQISASPINRSNQLHYEEEMLGNWLRRKLRR